MTRVKTSMYCSGCARDHSLAALAADVFDDRGAFERVFQRREGDGDEAECRVDALAVAQHARARELRRCLVGAEGGPGIDLPCSEGGCSVAREHEADLQLFRVDAGLAQGADQQELGDAASGRRHDHLLAGQVGHGSDRRARWDENGDAAARRARRGHDAEGDMASGGGDHGCVACRCRVDRAGRERLEERCGAREDGPLKVEGRPRQRIARLHLGAVEADLVAQHELRTSRRSRLLAAELHHDMRQALQKEQPDTGPGAGGGIAGLFRTARFPAISRCAQRRRWLAPDALITVTHQRHDSISIDTIRRAEHFRRS